MQRPRSIQDLISYHSILAEYILAQKRGLTFVALEELLRAQEFVCVAELACIRKPASCVLKRESAQLFVQQRLNFAIVPRDSAKRQPDVVRECLFLGRADGF